MNSYESNIQNLVLNVVAREQLVRKRVCLFSVLSAIVAAILVIGTGVYVSKAQKEITAAKLYIAELKAEIAASQHIIHELEDKIGSLQRMYDNLQYNADTDFGWERSDVLYPTHDKILKSKSAHEEIKKLILAKKVDVNITIRYYTKMSDKGKIDLVLRKCGYRQIVVDKNSYRAGLPTNAIRFSPTIDIENVKIIAYSLIRAGIDIKRIAPYPKRIQKFKPNSIEICGDKDAIESNPIQLVDIISAKKFE